MRTGSATKAGTIPIASLALALSTGTNAGVRGGVFVTVGTVGLGSLPSAVVTPIGSSQVFSSRHRTKVVWPNAVSRSANVVNGHALGYWPDAELISPAVRADDSLRAIGPTPDTEHPIPIVVEGCRPSPATAGEINLRPESPGDWYPFPEWCSSHGSDFTPGLATSASPLAFSTFAAPAGRLEKNVNARLLAGVE